MGQIKVEKNAGGIEGLCVIEPTVHGDARGYFMETYNQKDMEEAGLTGRSDSKARREALGEVLGIGYGNGGAFLKKLNRFGITKQQFMEALKKI